MKQWHAFIRCQVSQAAGSLGQVVGGNVGQFSVPIILQRLGTFSLGACQYHWLLDTLLHALSIFHTTCATCSLPQHFSFVTVFNRAVSRALSCLHLAHFPSRVLLKATRAFSCSHTAHFPTQILSRATRALGRLYINLLLLQAKDHSSSQLLAYSTLLTSGLAGGHSSPQLLTPAIASPFGGYIKYLGGLVYLGRVWEPRGGKKRVYQFLTRESAA